MDLADDPKQIPDSKTKSDQNKRDEDANQSNYELELSIPILIRRC